MDGKRFIQTIRLQNILSYGPETPPFELEPLNVLIGPNASGKSNLIEALSILAAAPRDIQVPFAEGGGVGEWLWKGPHDRRIQATIEVTVENLPWIPIPLRYRLSFTQFYADFTLREELLEEAASQTEEDGPSFYYRYDKHRSVIRPNAKRTSQQVLKSNEFRTDQSILSQLPEPLPVDGLSYVSEQFDKLRFYREFQVGHETPVRLPQPADLGQDYLLENGSNLAVVLSLLLNKPPYKKKLIDIQRDFYPSLQDILAVVLGGTVQVFFQEEGLESNVPATRLSDGSLRYLCLLAALYSRESPPVICIEEPEMGLHPDVIPKLANLLVEASQRSQIIVTTHSDILVDALSDVPEAVVVCEKVNGATQLQRLDPAELKVWLEDYRLGELWTRGDLGGNVW